MLAGPALAQSPPGGVTVVPKAPVRTAAVPASTALREDKLAYVQFDNTPFPYRGIVPRENKPFMDVASGQRYGHTNPRQGVLWEDKTFNDKRVLVAMPAGFDPRKPALTVVFFHGNGATLARDVVDRQKVFQQISDSGVNAVLLAPQFAIDAADSSSGRFWEAGRFNQFLREGARRAAELYGNPALRTNFERMPVVLVAYSGGYQPAAYAASIGGAGSRLQGLVLLDAVYAEEDKFLDWLTHKPRAAFFFSAYTPSTRPNNLALQKMLTDKKVAFRTTPVLSFTQGAITFLDTGNDLVHDDLVTKAWVNDPIAWIFQRIPGFSRRPPA